MTVYDIMPKWIADIGIALGTVIMTVITLWKPIAFIVIVVMLRKAIRKHNQKVDEQEKRERNEKE